jgi:ATP phosphoribosyltransferase
MAEETLELLDDCQLTVRKVNPRQYVADIDQLEHVEVWFQRASDVVRKIKSGDVDIGIVGYDMVQEYGEGDDDLVIVHDALGFGGCHLAVAVPNYGEFGNVSSLEELAAMPQWTEENPLRVVTGYTYLGQKFLTEKGFKHFTILTADGALEAAPAMGTADVILDLVSSGTTLRENNLRELAGGKVLASEGVLVANRRSLLEREGVIQAIKDILERLEAHLRAADKFSVVANVRAESEEDVAVKIHQHTDFPGLQGPTISPVYTYDSASGKACHNFYAITIIVPKPRLYDAVQQLRAIGGSGVLVSPLVYIFDEEPPRWRRLLKELGLESKY